MQLPSFENVPKCSLAETPRRAPLHCAANERSRARPLCIPARSRHPPPLARPPAPRAEGRDRNFSRGDFIYRNVVEPRRRNHLDGELSPSEISEVPLQRKQCSQSETDALATASADIIYLKVPAVSWISSCGAYHRYQGRMTNAGGDL